MARIDELNTRLGQAERRVTIYREAAMDVYLTMINDPNPNPEKTKEFHEQIERFQASAFAASEVIRDLVRELHEEVRKILKAGQ